MPATQLTEHFTLEEMTASQTAARMGIPNQPPPEVYQQLVRTCQMMELIRHELLDKPITVTSGYRSEAVNRAVGGVGKSQHSTGMAVDFICPGFGTPLEICQALEPKMAELGIDQLIHEYGSWVHVSQPGTGAQARHMALTISNSGTVTGIV